MRSSIAALLFLVVAPGLAAAQARTYAVLSLVGDRLMIVSREMSTGSRIDKNAHRFLEVGTPALDNTVLLAAESAIKSADPEATTVLLSVRDPAIFAAQSKALDQGGETARVLPAIMPALAGAKASYLVLVTKQRHEAMLEIEHGFTGQGNLEGVGFYVDRTKELINERTGATYVGFLAPFAYFKVSLIDLATGKILGEKAIHASQTRGNSEDVHPWDVLTAEQKVRVLQDMLRTETTQAMPAVLGR